VLACSFMTGSTARTSAWRLRLRSMMLSHMRLEFTPYSPGAIAIFVDEDIHPSRHTQHRRLNGEHLLALYLPARSLPELPIRSIG